MELITRLSNPEWWRQKCLEPRGGLFFLCRNVMMTLEESTPGYKELHPPTHQRLCNFVEQWALPGNKLLILMPRGWVKSYIVTVGWLVQRIIKNIMAGKRETWIINNATLPNAIQFLERIKYNLGYNDLLRGLFEDCLPSSPLMAERWIEREIQILGNKVETGAAEGNLVSRHYPGGIFNDDLVNRDNSQTKDQVDKVIDFWKLCQSLMLPNAIEFIPGTRWNYDDLYGHIITNHLKIPEEEMQHYRQRPYFEYHNGRYHMFHCSCWLDPPHEKGSTFPQIYTEKRLKEIKAEQGERFGGQYLNDPLALSQSKFKDSFFRNPWKPSELPDKRFTILLCDPSGKDSKESDYTGMVVVDAGIDKVCYIKSAVRKRITDSAACEWIITSAIQHRPTIIGIEENKFGTYRELIEFLLPQMNRQGKIPGDSATYAKRIPHFLVELQHHSRPKVLRIGNLAGYFEQNLLRMPPHGMQDLKDELLRFPLSNYDDLSDALAYLYDVVVYPGKDDTIWDIRDIPEEFKMTVPELLKKEWDELPAKGAAGMQSDAEETEETE
jgi:hypothetical protein